MDKEEIDKAIKKAKDLEKEDELSDEELEEMDKEFKTETEYLKGLTSNKDKDKE